MGGQEQVVCRDYRGKRYPLDAQDRTAYSRPGMRMVLGIILALAATSAAPAQTWQFTGAYTSQYLFRGQRLGGQSLQPQIEADGPGWGAGVWATEPLSNNAKVPGRSDPEVDPYAWYQFKLGSG